MSLDMVIFIDMLYVYAFVAYNYLMGELFLLKYALFFVSL